MIAGADGAYNERLIVALALAKADGVPQWGIATRSEMSPSLLSLIAHGHRTPSRTQAERIAAALGLPVDQLFDHVRKPGDPEESPEKGGA